MSDLAEDLDYLVGLEKIACERSLAQYIQSVWPLIEPATSLKWNWHLDTICGYLEAVALGKIQNLLINVPPGSMKSTLVSVGFPSWIWGPFYSPEKRFLGISNEQGLALRDALKAKVIMESEWYQNNWLITFDPRQNEKSLYQNTSLGFRQSLGVLSNATGKRGDFVLFDDLNDTIKVESASIRTSINDAYDLKYQNRINDPKTSSRIVIAQRTNIEDISGHLLEKKETQWTHVVIPNEYEGKKLFDAGKDIGRPELNDPRTEDGELYFEERFDAKSVRQSKEDLGPYGTAGQLQQRPSPKGGGLFKDDYWRYYEGEPPNIILVRVYADTASKTREYNDFTVFQAWGLSGNGNIYLLDQIRGKWKAPELERRAIAFWNKHKPTIHKPVGASVMKVEDKSSGTGLIQTIADNGQIPIEAIQRNTDKVVRAIGIIPRMAMGLVHLPANADFLNDYLTEFSLFTPLMTHKHDDQIDPTMDAVEDLIVFKDLIYSSASL